MRIFVCVNCGFESTKWLGRCTQCGEWNTFQEEDQVKKGKKSSPVTVHPISIEQLASEPPEQRTKTCIPEVDRVLGGGLVPGSTTLIAGEPGVGKSTLLLQASLSSKRKVLYISSEESAKQIASRAKRVSDGSKNVFVIFENSVETVFSVCEKFKPEIVVLDAVQSFWSEEINSAPGTVSQVRHITSKAVDFAKTKNIPVILVGHVTKEGIIAGPKVLEHMVDAVIYFEAEGALRILRATKNRYGSTGETGIFIMNEKGLEEILDYTKYFLNQNNEEEYGSCATAVLEGSRVYILEVQSLITRTNFPSPRRNSQGYDILRLFTILAVLEKICGLNFQNRDVYVNVVGGMKIYDVSADLAVALSLISSYFEIPIGGSVAFGELGLLGEVRSVSLPEQRIKSASRIGFKKVICPTANTFEGTNFNGVELKLVKNIKEFAKGEVIF